MLTPRGGAQSVINLRKTEVDAAIDDFFGRKVQVDEALDDYFAFGTEELNLNKVNPTVADDEEENCEAAAAKAQKADKAASEKEQKEDAEIKVEEQIAATKPAATAEKEDQAEDAKQFKAKNTEADEEIPELDESVGKAEARDAAAENELQTIKIFTICSLNASNSSKADEDAEKSQLTPVFHLNLTQISQADQSLVDQSLEEFQLKMYPKPNLSNKIY